MAFPLGSPRPSSTAFETLQAMNRHAKTAASGLITPKPLRTASGNHLVTSARAPSSSDAAVTAATATAFGSYTSRPLVRSTAERAVSAATEEVLTVAGSVLQRLPQSSPDSAFTTDGSPTVGSPLRRAVTVASAPTVSPAPSRHQIYWIMGDHKGWAEDLPGTSTIPPEPAYDYLTAFLNKPLTADACLQVHNHLSPLEQHGFCMTPTRSYCQAPIRYTTQSGLNVPDYADRQRAIDAFHKAGLGRVTLLYREQGIYAIDHVPQSRDDRRILSPKFALADLLEKYTANIAIATTPDEKLCVIAEFFQQFEWLCPFGENTRRTNLAILNLHLTQIGAHPVSIKNQYAFMTVGPWTTFDPATCRTNTEIVSILNILDLDALIAAIKQGLAQWEQLYTELPEHEQTFYSWRDLSELPVRSGLIRRLDSVSQATSPIELPRMPRVQAVYDTERNDCYVV